MNDIARHMDLLAALQAASERQSVTSFVYKLEMLGYLPSMFYHWITIGEERLDTDLPSGWCLEDLEKLVDLGHIDKYDEVIGKAEAEDRWVYFRFIEN